MTGQIDLIEEEIVLSHTQKQNEKKQQNSLDYHQPLSQIPHSDMGDQI